jgi:hypothetical protein
MPLEVKRAIAIGAALLIGHFLFQLMADHPGSISGLSRLFLKALGF